MSPLRKVAIQHPRINFTKFSIPFLKSSESSEGFSDIAPWEREEASRVTRSRKKTPGLKVKGSWWRSVENWSCHPYYSRAFFRPPCPTFRRRNDFNHRAGQAHLVPDEPGISPTSYSLLSIVRRRWSDKNLSSYDRDRLPGLPAPRPVDHCVQRANRAPAI